MLKSRSGQGRWERVNQKCVTWAVKAPRGGSPCISHRRASTSPFMHLKLALLLYSTHLCGLHGLHDSR